ncbi:hypothetical protein CLV62_10479 [Dysgonomonas alginatilytica]|uniref:Guanylate cyclase domain-containing protein n=1 Tax=Dysgonomonas alginatilytica TaxID=1605892 RepID=A0A2V3PSQ2_9BACT|nr:hypothetical protein [Dysgonomonas alginatilytica]PXV66819.1 hypothetical protein CLV62_10479 [Dysgonomonas alginatilytica]
MTTKDQPIWKSIDNRFVAYFDILGFKDYVFSNSTEDIHKMLISLNKILPSDNDEEISEKHILCTTFSDSIFIFTKSDSIEEFRNFIQFIRRFMRNSIRRKIPLKASIAYGEIVVYRDRKIFCGKPIVNAFLLQEDLQYMGIVIHHSVEDYIIKKNKYISNKYKRYFKEIDTPFKYGYRKHMNIDYTILELNTSAEMRSKIEDRKRITSGNPRKYIDNTLKIFDKFDELNLG